MSTKGDSLSFLKPQTCVLKVSIHCEGCKKKVKKLLQKIDGVYTISIDSEQGKVTVTGSADPSTLIKKLCKAGKHAELIMAPKSTSANVNGKNLLHEQLQKLQLGTGKGQQGGGGKDKKGQQVQQMKGFQDLKLPEMKNHHKTPPQKDQKNVKKFSPPSEDEGSDFNDDDDLYDSEDDDEYDDDMDGMKPSKEKKGDGHKDGKNGSDHNKKGGPSGHGKSNGGNNSSKDNNGGKKTGQPMNFNPKMTIGQGVKGMDMGKMNAPMDHPMSLNMGGMAPGYYHGGITAAGNPYQQQQYMQQRMMMNGPIINGQPMAYGQSSTGYYMPPPAPYGEPAYAQYFSDENPSSCSIM